MVVSPKSAVACAQPREVARAVDELDFDRIYEHYFSFVWRSLLRLGVSQSNIDDAAQDTFLVVHRRLADFEGRASIKTWLFSVAQRVALNYRRRERKALSEMPVPLSLLDAKSCPEQKAESVRAAAFLNDFLNGLDDGKRAVFILVELEQMTAPEAADALGVNVNTVYSRLRVARAAFRSAAELTGRLIES